MNSRSESTLGKQGRVVIPAHLRHALDLKPGDRLIARQDGDRIVLERPEAVERRLKSRLANIPKGVSLVDELLADRRAEAVKDQP
ncbi:MAG: AbrB/MazE/SpoVT family DNA-binding domain-containing protein [Gammaproteobacteria bacterium]|nr:AbrB/MazE/SpoVT family DNA-binding domain-containing protein [Gammaproteobacteria bacterium]TVQ50440.1 MAG: AbrB/MazE/SpoVT family DNA-binding domain-containing protein [Gammaproteobacteria bacterium]